jgi:hypothetical protein
MIIVSEGMLYRAQVEAYYTVLPDHKFDSLILTFAQETDIPAGGYGGYVYTKLTRLFHYFPQNMTNAEGEITHNTLVLSDTEDTRKFSKKDPGKRKYPSH